MLLDIDHFKRFNDTWGHQTGDQVLRLVAMTLKSNIKGKDMAARYGGEEFAAILPETDLEGAMIVADNIRKAVQAKELLKRSTNEKLGRITASFGVAMFRAGRHALDPDRARRPLPLCRQARRPQPRVERDRAQRRRARSPPPRQLGVQLDAEAAQRIPIARIGLADAVGVEDRDAADLEAGEREAHRDAVVLVGLDPRPALRWLGRRSRGSAVTTRSSPSSCARPGLDAAELGGERRDPVALLDAQIGDADEAHRRVVERREHRQRRNGVLHLRAVDHRRHAAGTCG